MEVITTTRRQNTRRSLLDAAQELVAARGHDRISIQEITEKARVATGTYYNYFETKTDIFAAVAEEMKLNLADQIDQSRAAITDPAMRVAVTLKYYLFQAVDNKQWREFVSSAGVKDCVLMQSAEQTIEDLQRGIKAGRFRMDDVHFTQALIHAMARHVVLGIQRGDTGRNAIEYTIRSILQMLGLPDLVSKALTQSPLPPLPAPRRTPTDRKPEAVKASVLQLSDHRADDHAGYIDPVIVFKAPEPSSPAARRRCIFTGSRAAARK